jgi:hypothetical protein
VATLRFETISFDMLDVRDMDDKDYVTVNNHPITTVRI